MNCIRKEFLDPIVNEVLERKKIKVGLIMCPQEDCNSLVDKKTITQLANELLQNNVKV